MVGAEKCAGCGMDVTPGNTVSVKVYGAEDISERWHLRCYHTADDATTGEDWPMTAEGVAEPYEWVRRTYQVLKR